MDSLGQSRFVSVSSPRVHRPTEIPDRRAREGGIGAAQTGAFSDAVCRIIETRPETTYDNFARDFGERFVPGNTRPSTVDFLMKAPFEE